MSFIAFKIADYLHTAEREQYRAICNLLRLKYRTSDELCVFLANYNISDCELDGVLIKSDAIISIELKNYGGEIKAVENGQWTLSDGTIIKGGSRKSVYQQAKCNHVALKNGLKDAKVLPAKLLRDIPSLVVFAQPITLQNNLGPKVRSWLHICDIDHFIEKVEDITAPNLDLSNEELLDLLPKLGLREEFIDKRFWSDTNDIDEEPPVQNSEDGSTFGGISTSPIVTVGPVTTAPSDNTNVDANENSTRNEYQNFIRDHVLPAIDVREGYKLQVIPYKDFGRISDILLPFTSEFVAILQKDDASKYVPQLQRIFKKKVMPLSNDVISWGEGEFVFSETKESTNSSSEPFLNLTKSSIQKTKQLPIRNNSSEIELPTWLDSFIFRELGAMYQPDYDRFSYNLDLDKNESKIYLGTYFPRSFGESYLIFSSIFCDSNFVSLIKAKPVIKVLDFGCGAGGELFGLLEAIEKSISQKLEIKIVGIDGNHNSLHLLERIVSKYNERGKNHIKLQLAPCLISSLEDLSLVSEAIGSDYDFIIASKVLGELECRKVLDGNVYELFASFFAPLLAQKGIMSILDVTVKNKELDVFLPQRMNEGVNQFLSGHLNSFKSIAPCSGITQAGPCKNGCFFKKEIFISHSLRLNDVSKFSVRVLSRTGVLIDTSSLHENLNNFECIYK